MKIDYFCIGNKAHYKTKNVSFVMYRFLLQCKENKV